ncbi:MAG TPA: ABC transporter ATP-binding protein [Actinomycetales bacterium]|nr:ABC transporter ATP-binding protein [Actinomycetales bacterium]
MSDGAGSAAPSAGLDADVRVRRPAFEVRVRLMAGPGEVVGVLGPNGAGKSTVLRALAGLMPLAAGHVRVDGATWADLATGALVPPEGRSLGMVFQDYLLFPHMTALENVAFGLRARGVGRREARSRALAWLERMGLEDLAGSRPGRLSGGQAQRVALARALVTGPRLLLLDEPLAALDAGTRLSVRAQLGGHLREYGGVSVLVTHDPLDAMVLADRLVVLEGGQVVQEGPPLDVARAPRTDYVAQLVGLNLLRGKALDGSGHDVLLTDGGVLKVASAAGSAASDVLLAFSPAAVALHRHRPDGSPRNTWEATVSGLERHGDVVRVRLDGEPPVLADVTTAAVAELRLMQGQRVWVSLKATEISAYPA